MLSHFEYLHWRYMFLFDLLRLLSALRVDLGSPFVDVPFSLVIFFLILISVYASYCRSYFPGDVTMVHGLSRGRSHQYLHVSSAITLHLCVLYVTSSI